MRNDGSFTDLITLVSGFVNGDPPDRETAAKADLPALFALAEKHMLTRITAAALERAGVRDEAFVQAGARAARKAAILDAEREAVLSALDEAGIRHMPLKGSVLQDLYPSFGMRQMGDVDILYDAERMEDVRQIMTGLGFRPEGRIGTGAHDCYVKEPVCFFEMHRSLFGGEHDPRFRGYYADVMDRLLPEPGTRCGLRFRDEDFYVYLLAHEYKHFTGGGTGLRSFLDVYVFLKKKSEGLDRDCIRKETDRLGLSSFEEMNRSLSLRLFGGGELTEEDREILDYVLSSGIYGNVGNRVDNRVRAYGGGIRGKFRYVLRRIFLPMGAVRSVYPLFAEHPVLLPFLPVYRLVRGLPVRGSRLKAELKALRKRGAGQGE